MKRIIDLHTWERREEFGFFCDFINPYVNVTCYVDYRTAKASAHKDGASFFLYYLYAILKAVNEIPELRHRIDVDGNIVEYNRIDYLRP